MGSPAVTARGPVATFRGLRVLTRPRAIALSRQASFDALLVCALTGAALVLSLAHPWNHAYVGAEQFGDAAYWDFAGESWARGYVATKAPDIRPGYSIFLGIVYTLWGASWQHAFVGQAALYAAGVGMLYAMGRRLGGRLVGILAALLLTLDPYMWEWTATSTTELLGSIASLGSVFFLVKSLRPRHRLVWAALFGVCLSIANVVRPVGLPYLGLAVVVVLVLLRARLRQRLALSGVAIAAAIITLAPSVVYQYASTGDAGLSSNGAANLFAASSPKYKTWVPAIYDDVAAQLKARGVDPNPQNMNAEFMRLTIQNYLTDPGYQAQRIFAGLRTYTAFEGGAERPDQYFFFRPGLLMIFSVVAAGLALVGSLRITGIWRLAPAPVLVFALRRAAFESLVVLQTWGVVSPVLRLVRRRGHREVGVFLVALFWLSTGVLAILTTGIEGFFLNRLYTQVEPERALLLALAATEVLFLLMPRSRAFLSVLQLRWFVRRTPRLPGASRFLAYAGSLVLAAVVIVGGIRLIAVNALPPTAGDTFQPLGVSDLSNLATQLRAPGPLTYVKTSELDGLRDRLISRSRLPDLGGYVLPGQFTRFLWHLGDEDRTVFWFVVADGTHPTTLDRNLLMAELPGDLTEAEVGNQPGMLVVVPSTSYYDAIGDVAQFNVLQTRAWIPWDALGHQLRLDAIRLFPLSATLYDHLRFESAKVQGSVAEAGPQRVKVGDLLLRALSFEPRPLPGEDAPTASMTYSDIWLPSGGQVRGWVAVHPRFFMHAAAGTLRVQVHVQTGAGDDAFGEVRLDPMNQDQQRYLPFQIDLPSYPPKQRGSIQIRVVADGSPTEVAQVFFAEPQVVQP